MCVDWKVFHPYIALRDVRMKNFSINTQNKILCVRRKIFFINVHSSLQTFFKLFLKNRVWKSLFDTFFHHWAKKTRKNLPDGFKHRIFGISFQLKRNRFQLKKFSFSWKKICEKSVHFFKTRKKFFHCSTLDGSTP